MNKEIKWYAVYTRPKWEKKVAHLLAKKGIEEYCPLNKVCRQWSDRKKMVQEPLFTSYVFIRVTEADHLKVKQTEGVLNLVHWLGKPAVIKEEEIEVIKHFLNDYQNVQLEKAEVNINDRVRIIDGPLLSIEGKVIAVMNHSVKVVLPSLGYTMTAKVQKSHIEKVPADEKTKVIVTI
ncbi:UpxY family transcription antiterminator [Ilyomonas limi]|uniref:UpxY family transcription antiterminator n=1 Tax=Ilyomonas limi TaxID=2575867 RepID=A0A4U3L5A3_9BACT|nr:UpxY family transcription antiterminator [Ilyomonas limi]TKK70325.1 UpxY family transcription antiterminator [Ilyomonas limi]